MEIQEQVRNAVLETLAPLKAEVTKAVSGELAQEITKVGDSLTEVRAQLAKLEERGDVKPTDDKVKELEKRLVESEEAIRVIRISPALPSNGKKDAADIFKGLFIKDAPGLRNAISGYRNGLASGDAETRAISSALFATGGRLPAEVSDQFIDFLIEQQVTLPRVVTRRMMSPEAHTDELTISARKMRKATEDTAPTVANAFGTKRRTLNTVEVIWAENVSLGWLEDNLERAGSEQHIVRMLATQFGNDANDLGWNGDVADTADLFRVINNGWITLAQDDSDTHNVDFTDTSVGDPGSLEGAPSSLLHIMSTALPYKFKGRTDLAFTTPIRFAESYANELSARQTALGDRVMIGGFPEMRYFGRQVRPEPHFIEENADKVVLTGDGNLFFGIQRSITMETEWKPRERRLEITCSARTDYQYATGDAIVLGSGLPTNLRA
jgi:hypothetical protein